MYLRESNLAVFWVERLLTGRSHPCLICACSHAHLRLTNHASLRWSLTTIPWGGILTLLMAIMVLSRVNRYIEWIIDNVDGWLVILRWSLLLLTLVRDRGVPEATCSVCCPYLLLNSLLLQFVWWNVSWLLLHWYCIVFVDSEILLRCL